MRPLDKCVVAIFLAFVALRISGDPISPNPNPPNPDIGKGMRVVWVVETSEKVPSYITNQFASRGVREYLNTHCAKDGEQPAYRIYDPQTDLTNTVPVWKTIMDSPRKSVPWLYVTNGRKLSTGVPPQDIPSLMTLLQKYGGK